MNKVIKTQNLGKVYPLPRGVLRVLQEIDFELEAGDFVGIMGASGVGKTTFLNLLGALDKPTEGTILLDGEDILSKEEADIARIRNRKIGFVFQFFHLLPEFTALENVCFPLYISGMDKEKARERGMRGLRDVFLEDKAHFRPAMLSGGEQQRVAIARALANEPKVLLADEPTGNLDWKTGEMILRLIQDLHHKRGLSSVIVTHNEKVARFCQELYLIEGGKLKPLLLS